MEVRVGVCRRGLQTLSVLKKKSVNSLPCLRQATSFLTPKMFNLFRAHVPEKHIFSSTYPFWPNREQAPGLKRLNYKTYLYVSGS